MAHLFWHECRRIKEKGDDITLKICTKRALTFFLWLFPASISGMFVKELVNGAHQLLHKYFGNAFPLYDPITEGAAADAQEATLSTLSFFATMLIITFISTRFNNGAYEYVIDKTDGLYRVIHGVALYEKRFLISDMAASFFAPLPFLIAIPFIPERFFFFTVMKPLLLWQSFYLSFGIFSLPILFIALTAFHTLVLFPVLKIWRAKWLTAFAQ